LAERGQPGHRISTAVGDHHVDDRRPPASRGLIEYTRAGSAAGTAAAAAALGALLAVVCTATTRTLSPARSSAAGSRPFFNATATKEDPGGGVSVATVAPLGSSCPGCRGVAAYCPTTLVCCDQSRVFNVPLLGTETSTRSLAVIWWPYPTGPATAIAECVAEK